MNKILHCQNCDWEGTEEELGKTLTEIHHLWDRVAPGEITPYGECPNEDCGGMCHEREEPKQFGMAIALLGSVADGYRAIGPFPTYSDAVDYASDDGEIGNQVMSLEAQDHG